MSHCCLSTWNVSDAYFVARQVSQTAATKRRSHISHVRRTSTFYGIGLAACAVGDHAATDKLPELPYDCRYYALQRFRVRQQRPSLACRHFSARTTRLSFSTDWIASRVRRTEWTFGCKGQTYRRSRSSAAELHSLFVSEQAQWQSWGKLVAARCLPRCYESFNPFNASCSKLLLFEGFSAILA